MDNDLKVCVFFDVDHTLVKGSTGSLYIKYLYKRKLITLSKVLQALFWNLQYKFNLLNRNKFSHRILKWLEGTPEKDTRQINREFVYDKLKSYLYADALNTIDSHRNRGHEIVLFSAESNYMIEPIGELIKVDKFICTELEVKNGVFLGCFKEPFCYGEGKLQKLYDYANNQNLDLKNCYVYSDSIVDLSSLEAVGNPVVVNPDRFLKKEAKKRKWKTAYFNQ